MENRWQFSYTSDQIDKLIYVTFAVDGREIPAPIEEPADAVPAVSATQTTRVMQIKNWAINS